MTVSVPKPGPRVLIMLDKLGKITAVHTNDHVQVLCIHERGETYGGQRELVTNAPAGLTGYYATYCAFDNLVRQYFVNRVFKLFGR